MSSTKHYEPTPRQALDRGAIYSPHPRRHPMTAPRAALPVRDIADLLDRGADYLDRHGWTPRGLYGPHTRCTGTCRVHRTHTHTYAASVTGALRAALYGRAMWFTDHTDPDALHLYS